jgi:O-antigen/teichoic acid export membrane protein
MDRIKQKAHTLLRKSETYFKTDMLYLAKGGSWLTFGQLITSASSFVLSVAFANLMPQAAYGTYRYVTSLAATLSAFSLTGVGTAVTQSVARGFENVIRSAFWMNVRWSALLVAISLVGSIYYFIQGNTTLSISLLFIGSFSPFLNSAHLATYYANGKKDFTRLSIYNIAKGVVPALALIATLFVTKNVLIIIFVYFLANTAIALLTYQDAIRFYKPNTTDDPGILDYSKKLSLLGMLSTLTAQADKILIFTHIGAAELAIYSIAMAFPEQIKSALRNLNFLMIPKFAERDPEHIADLRGKIVKLSLLLIGITVLYIIVAPLLYKLFFPKYATDAVQLSQLFSLSILAAIAMIPNSLMIAHKRNKDLFVINTASAIIQLAFLAIGIYWGGMLGVAISKVVSAYISVILSFIAIKKYHAI